MKTKKIQIALIALLIIGAVSTKVSAQAGEFKIGPAVALVMPTGDFSSMTTTYEGSEAYNKKEVSHNTGFGIGAAAKYGLNDFLSVVGELGWNSVSEDVKFYPADEIAKVALKTAVVEPTLTNSGSYNFFNFTAGIRANVGFVYAEARAGYIGGDQGGFGFVPAIGGEFKNFDVQANYTINGNASYFGLRLAYYFGL